MLPLILIITAYGANKIVNLEKFSSPRYKRFILITFILLILVPSYWSLRIFYTERANKSRAAKIKDSKEALIYLQNKISPNSLIVLPIIDRALNHYLVKEVTKRNIDVVKNRKIKNIFFIGPKEFKFLPYGAPMKDPKDELFLNSDISKNILIIIELTN